MIKKLRKYSILIYGLIFLIPAIHSFGQDSSVLMEGAVSYITGQNIYVRFTSTLGIENGDTLFFQENGQLIPALVVQHHSSISCLCVAIGKNILKVSDVVVARKMQPQRTQTPVTQMHEIPEKDVNEQVLTSPENKAGINQKQDFTGRVSLSSYSNFSNSGEDIHRFRYTLSAKASNISESKLSAETYISFSHKLNQWNEVQENLNNAIKIYNLALRYDFSETATLWAGRKINPRIANIGAVDGLQFEYGFKKMFAGVVAGSRPDYLDYGYNLSLFEYGAYFGQSQKAKNGFIQSSVAFLEQRNSGNVDRRFVYVQHTNSAVKNLNVFSSLELELYQMANNQPQNTLNLTSFYLSANYRVSWKLSLSGSYDNRKNVIYYETFRNYADEILQQASRQGVRLRINYRPLNYLMFGASGGTRFRKEDPRPSNSINGYATWSRVPLINASLNVSANVMQTSYLAGQIYGARVSKDIIPGKIYSTLQYRRVDFNYVNSATILKQNIGEVDFSYQINKKLYLTVNFEATIQENDWFNRLYLNLRIKF
ncbi:MAG: hypothetical protein V2I31_12140 [Mariniphaga sp.]|nr:hypothetical protein [Mariniphaga sp.]